MDKGQDNRDMTELYQGWVGNPAGNTIIFSEIVWHFDTLIRSVCEIWYVAKSMTNRHKCSVVKE